MYYRLFSAAFASHKAIADTYNASGCERGIGVYMVVMNHVTREFFQTLTPDPLSAPLHATFLEWLASAEAALTEEVELGQPFDSQRARNFASATKRLGESMDTYVKSTEKAEPQKSA